MSASAEGCVPDPSGNSEARTPEATIDSAKIPKDPEIIKSFDDSPPLKPDISIKACRTFSFDLGKDKKEKPKRRYRI